ncbi:MAG: tetratricopeptide repeat protein [Planctomycetes bacterium]|nr:tetratricopeptide repeat protein [Planctomycetota bacterium]
MKSRLFTRMRTLIAAGMLVAFGSPVSRPIENPAIFNPVNYSTIPPSSYQNNSISSPITIDLNGNLVITGNVRRGMHFQDGVPYESPTNFRGVLGSSTLNSFMRDSAGTEDVGNSVNRYGIQPYYLRSRTVATTRPGYSGVFRQEETRIKNRTLRGRFPTGTFVSDSGTQTFSGRDTLATEAGLSGTLTQYDTATKPPTIVTSIRELQKLTQQVESNISAKDQQLIERYRKQDQETEDVKQEAGITFEPRPVITGLEHKQSLMEKYSSLNLFDQSRTTERAETTVPEDGRGKVKSYTALAEAYAQANAMSFRDVTISTEDDIDIQAQGDSLGLDIVEQVKKQLEDLVKSIESTEDREAGSTSEDTRTNIGLGSRVLSSKESSLISSESITGMLDELKGLSQADLSAKAKSIRGSHTRADTFSMSRFNHHFKEAQDHLKGGRYYAAADSFALASIYKPNEPLCFSGKGHALLGAGEYISSALFLSRAIESNPEYVKTKVNLAATLGGQHILESRIADIREWLLRSGSGNLDFLLGYVYYRMGRLGPAQQAINAAYVKTPQSAAVVAVKKAVDDALAGK